MHGQFFVSIGCTSDSTHSTSQGGAIYVRDAGSVLQSTESTTLLLLGSLGSPSDGLSTKPTSLRWLFGTAAAAVRTGFYESLWSVPELSSTEVHAHQGGGLAVSTTGNVTARGQLRCENLRANIGACAYISGDGIATFTGGGYIQDNYGAAASSTGGAVRPKPQFTCPIIIIHFLLNIMCFVM